MYLLKRFQYKSPYERWMFVILAVGLLIRFLLIFFNTPVTNSDESNMGLVALHVAFQGDHPAFFYGLPYMGPVEGYLAAPLFHLLGASVFTLRLALLPFYIGFFLGMFYLVRLLYNEKFALASVILLSLGSADVIFLQIRAVGEYPEIEMFAALICLLVVSLALSSHLQNEERMKRIILYGILGLIIGLAIWVDFLIAPFVAMGLLLLCLFCRREMLHWPALSLLVGSIIGAFPLIYYNLTAPFAQNSWNILLFIHRGGAETMKAHHLTWLHQLSGTMLISLPLATGANPSCPVNDFPPFGPLTRAGLPCVVSHAAWGLGFFILWFVAVALALRVVWRYRHHLAGGSQQDNLQDTAFEERQETIRRCGQLLILASVFLTTILYAVSPSAAVYSDSAYRYLACLLLAIPVLLWPVWHGLTLPKISWNWWATGGLILRGGLLLFVLLTFTRETGRTFQEIPTDQAAYQSEQALISNLLRVGATRFYSEYWTCNRLIFDTQEKIICSVVGDHLEPGFDRYLPYRSIVRAAPHVTYIFPLGSPQIGVLEQKIANTHYRKYQFDGYVVYMLT